MSKGIYKAVAAKLEGEISYHKANIEVYMSNPVGIGEHPDVLGAIVEELEKLAHAEELLESWKSNFKS